MPIKIYCIRAQADLWKVCVCMICTKTCTCSASHIYVLNLHISNWRISASYSQVCMYIVKQNYNDPPNSVYHFSLLTSLSIADFLGLNYGLKQSAPAENLPRMYYFACTKGMLIALLLLCILFAFLMHFIILCLYVLYYYDYDTYYDYAIRRF